VKAYTLTYSGGDKVTATEITTGTIPANTPVLLNGEGSADFAGSGVAIDADAAPGVRGFIGFGDETTGIESVQGEGVKVNGSENYYNLNGQRVAQPTKGLYIQNGKKVIVK